MKIKLLITTLLLALFFSGCISQKNQTIEIETLSNGSKKYSMKKAKPNIQTKRYRGYKIEGYDIALSAANDTITLTLIHDLSFTQGTGTPIKFNPFSPKSDEHNPHNFSKERWAYEKFWLGLKKVDIVGLQAQNYSKTKYHKSSLFDWFTESISTTYNKQDFINFVKTHSKLPLDIKTQKRDMKTDVIGLEYVQRFIACLENEAKCKDKEEPK